MLALAAYLVIYHKFSCNQLRKHHIVFFFYFDLAALHKAPCLGEIASSYLVMMTMVMIAVIAMTMVIAVMEIKMVMTAIITMMTMLTMKIARPFGRRRF